MTEIIRPFDLKSKSPNFKRDQFQTLEEMGNYNPEFIDEGHICYCVETGKHYFWSSSNTTNPDIGQWSPMVKSGSDYYTVHTDKVAASVDSLDSLQNLVSSMEGTLYSVSYDVENMKRTQSTSENIVSTALNQLNQKPIYINGKNVGIGDQLTIDKTLIGLGNVDNTADLEKPISRLTQAALDRKVSSEIGKDLVDVNWTYSVNEGMRELTSHLRSPNTNPHNTTKQDVGLGRVDNTSDIEKPISEATQRALDGKVNIEAGKRMITEDEARAITAASSMNSHLLNYNNPHAVTKHQVGLGNVNNTSDSEKLASDLLKKLSGFYLAKHQISETNRFCGIPEIRGLLVEEIGSVKVIDNFRNLSAKFPGKTQELSTNSLFGRNLILESDEFLYSERDRVLQKEFKVSLPSLDLIRCHTYREAQRESRVESNGTSTGNLLISIVSSLDVFIPAESYTASSKSTWWRRTASGLGEGSNLTLAGLMNVDGGNVPLCSFNSGVYSYNSTYLKDLGFRIVQKTDYTIDDLTSKITLPTTLRMVNRIGSVNCYVGRPKLSICLRDFGYSEASQKEIVNGVHTIGNQHLGAIWTPAPEDIVANRADLRKNYELVYFIVPEGMEELRIGQTPTVPGAFEPIRSSWVGKTAVGLLEKSTKHFYTCWYGDGGQLLPSSAETKIQEWEIGSYPGRLFREKGTGRLLEVDEQRNLVPAT